MEYRKLGNSGLDVSAIGLGTNNFGNPKRIPDPAQSARVVHKCLDVGINFIDTAISYGQGQSEVHIGEALKGRRGDAIVAGPPIRPQRDRWRRGIAQRTAER